MHGTNAPVSLITDTNLRGFFQESVTDAMQRQRVVAEELTVIYLVNLLQSFLRSEDLYSDSGDGLELRPLAEHYAEAVNAESAAAREQALRRLGDVALFITGVFADSLSRKPIDVDYYVSMGGTAYGCLAEACDGQRERNGFGQVFAELAAKFVDFTDVLATVHEQMRMRSDADLLRLYESWLRTGSNRAARLLRSAGIEPVMPGGSPLGCH